MKNTHILLGALASFMAASALTASEARLPIRDPLVADRIYYVRTDGSDSNMGLINDASGAFLTIQRAVDVACGDFDLGNFNVTIQVAAGTYSGTVVLGNYVSGTGQISIVGDETTPSNVVLTTSSGNLITADSLSSTWTLAGLRLSTSGSGGACLYANAGSRVSVRNLDFAAAVSGHIVAGRNAVVSATGNYSISGDSSTHFYAFLSGVIDSSGQTVALTGTPSFAYSFASVWDGGFIQAIGTTFSGSATGVKYTENGKPVVYTTGGGAAMFPGSSGGTSRPAREVLTADRTYYVRGDGSDSSSGLVNSASGAFLTIQRAINVVSNDIDLGLFNVVIQIDTGTYTESLILRRYVGNGVVTIRGNETTPSSVVLSPVAGDAINADNVTTPWTIRGLHIVAPVNGIDVLQCSILFFANIEFGNCLNHINAASSSVVIASGNYTIVGGAANHAIAQNGATVLIRNRNVTLTGTPGFSSAFLLALRGGAIRADGNTFFGAATGTRYNAQLNGVIDSGAAGPTYLPGNMTGVATLGGIYN